jgi:hypothetical protein
MEASNQLRVKVNVKKSQYRNEFNQFINPSMLQESQHLRSWELCSLTEMISNQNLKRERDRETHAITWYKSCFQQDCSRKRPNSSFTAE